MNRPLLSIAFLLALGSPAAAQEPTEPPTPASVVAEAPEGDWRAIDPADLLVMVLEPEPDGAERRVVIQLLPPPFSQGWVDNIRTLARAHWWDGTTVYRVVDNWVAQWGDGEDDGEPVKPPPAGLRVVPESEYVARLPIQTRREIEASGARDLGAFFDPYGLPGFHEGWPVARPKPGEPIRGLDGDGDSLPDPPDEPVWPVHCYGAVGVARDLSPDTGTGAELYAVIGHAPRQLDRNIAVVARVIEGIEHLATLPRGTGEAGVYADPAQRVPILSVWLGDELPEADRPRFEYLATESDSFSRYVEVRANRNDAFYKVPAGGVDVCNVQVPIRRVPAE